METVGKTCKGCPSKGVQPLAEFYRHSMMADGYLNFCKDCVKTRVRKHYAATLPERHAYDAKRYASPRRKAANAESARRHRINNPDKSRARVALNRAVRSGLVTKTACRCGSSVAQAHHADYSKPLDVEWVCFKCHREKFHGQTVTSSYRPTPGRS